VAGGYLGFLALLKAQEGGEINRVVSKNECGSTPLWRKEEQVVNLREHDYKTFMARREGRYLHPHAASTTPRMSPSTIPMAFYSEVRPLTLSRNSLDLQTRI
jgi:hypothetical protein